MKPIRIPICFAHLFILCPAPVALADNLVGDHAIIADSVSSEAGDLSVEGSLDVMGGISFGTLGTTGQPGVLMSHTDGKTIFESLDSGASFLWSEPTISPNPANEKMLLGWDNSLTLFKSDGVTPGVLLNPNTGALTLSGTNSGIYDSVGNPVIQIGSNGTASFPGVVTFTQGIQLSAGLTSSGQIVSGQDGSLNSLTVGRGGGNILNNAVLGYNALAANISGNFNVAVGYRALVASVWTSSNVAIGYETLVNNTVGENNVAIGTHSLAQNISGRDNMAVGVATLYANTSGMRNIALGITALQYNTTGSSNSALGADTLHVNNGNNNVAVGASALRFNTSASENVAVGAGGLYRNVTGIQNTVLGAGAGSFNETGSNNVMIGWNSGTTQAVTLGLQTAQNSIYIGSSARGFSNADDNTIVIGSNAVGEGANTTVIGNANTTLARIHGTVNAPGVKTANLEIEQPDELQDALSVDGRTLFNGQTRFEGEVLISQPQGDISMGIYE